MQDGFDNRVLTSRGLTREETFEFCILAFIDELYVYLDCKVMELMTNYESKLR